MLPLNIKVFVHRFMHFLKEIIVWCRLLPLSCYVFGRHGLSVRQQYYLQSNEWICMKLLSEVCLRPRNNPLNLEMIRISLRSGSNTLSLRRRFAVSD